jgi:VanZ family protein
VTETPGRAAGGADRSAATTLVRYWLPVAAYVALIFSFSSIKGSDLPGGFPNMDKIAHLLEYSLLGLLSGRAIRFTLTGRGRVAASIATILFGASVGAADELYQRGTPGRSCDIRDWIVDILAVSLAVVLTQWASSRALRTRARTNRAEVGEGKA